MRGKNCQLTSHGYFNAQDISHEPPVIERKGSGMFSSVRMLHCNISVRDYSHVDLHGGVQKGLYQNKVYVFHHLPHSA